MEILINYEAVYTKALALRSRLENETRDMNGGYRTMQSALRHMDGSTNAELTDALTVNQTRTEEMVDGLRTVLLAMESAALETEQEEQRIEHIFNSAIINRPPEGGIQ